MFPPRPSPALMALAWFLLTRVTILAIGFLGVATFVDQHALAVQGAAALDPATVWHKWDSLWYEQIAVHGYRHQLDTLRGQAAAAYFPLYPLTVGVILQLLPGASFFWVGSALSSLCTLTACALIVRHFATDVSHAHRVLLFVLASAGSFYFSIPYTEGLFLLQVVLVMVLARSRWYVAAGLVSGLAAVTRAQGLALIAVPLLACLCDRSIDWRRRLLRSGAILALLALPVAVYFLFLADVQGSAVAFVDRQTMWSNARPYPFRAIVGLFEHPRRVQAYPHAATWFLYAALTFRYIRRLPPGEVLFCLGALLISTQQDVFSGAYRYVAVLVPLALGLAADRPPIRGAMMVFNLVLGTLMALAFVTNNRLTI